MIGEQQTGTIDSVVVSALPHEGIRVMHAGAPARLAVLDANGNVIAEGGELAEEVEAVVVQAYRNLLKGTGHLRVLSKPIKTK